MVHGGRGCFKQSWFVTVEVLYTVNLLYHHRTLYAKTHTSCANEPLYAVRVHHGHILPRFGCQNRLKEPTYAWLSFLAHLAAHKLPQHTHTHTHTHTRTGKLLDLLISLGSIAAGLYLWYDNEKHTHTHTCIHSRTHPSECGHIRTHTHARARTHPSECGHIRTHTHTHARARTHTHTQGSSLAS